VERKKDRKKWFFSFFFFFLQIELKKWFHPKRKRNSRKEDERGG